MSRSARQVVIWAVGLLVTAVMLSLGLWQMRSFEDQGQEALIQRLHEPPVELTSVAPAGREPGDAYGRTVRATGTYLPAQQVLVPDDRVPGRFRVLTALQLPDGSIVGVVRGVSLDTDPPAPPTGIVVQEGVFLPSEGEPKKVVAEGQLATIRLPRLAQLWPQPLTPGFINLNATGSAAQRMTAAEVTMPSNAGNARSQGYALQWWIFAAAAVAATIKLSRDAAKGTGFVPDGSPADFVDGAGDNPAVEADSSTAAAAEMGPGELREPTTVNLPAAGEQSRSPRD